MTKKTKKWMGSFVIPPPQTLTDSQGVHAREDMISLSMSDMQETRQKGCKRQFKQRRVKEKKKIVTKGDRLMI